MTLEEVRRACNAQPFQPFVIRLADRREYSVPSREYLLVPAAGRIVVVYQPDDAFHHIDLQLVTELEFRSSPDGSRRRRRG